MAKRFKFRKMYFVCEDGKVIEDNIAMTNAYKDREVAQTVCDSRTQQNHKMWDDKTKPFPKHTVEGFYLVHESLFEK
ncbi:MAG: hypothetical protein EOO20_22155 [Chryseobacterium sp.]|nr:MAG: hypothetical protein EOO20_22155 [Chryseobacterium sp.]